MTVSTHSTLLQRPALDSPPPQCRACRHPLHDVRAYRRSEPTPYLIVQHCLSQCERCSTPHVGMRALALIGRRLRHIHQAFDRYTDDRKAALDHAGDELVSSRSPLETRPAIAYPQQPIFAIWFENTQADPARATPHAAVIGLPADALRILDECTVLERRPAKAEGYLSGALVAFPDPPAALMWLEALRATARLCGTIAWCRRYDDATVAATWDGWSPAPGNSTTLKPTARESTP